MRELVQRTADQLSPKRDRVVVAAIAGDTVEIVGDPDAVYEIGSITKVFTALALARLTVAGEARLDEPLSDLLPSAPPPITLRHLATHTAGLALSKRTGLGYDELLVPPGLDGTGVTRQPIQGHNARGKPVPPWHMVDMTGAGGLRSTATDLVTFLRAQLAATDEAVRVSRSVRHDINPYAWVHLGWLGRRLPGGREQLWHNGGTGGFCSFAGLEPARGVAVLALSNTAGTMDGPALKLLTAIGED